MLKVRALKHICYLRNIISHKNHVTLPIVMTFKENYEIIEWQEF